MLQSAQGVLGFLLKAAARKDYAPGAAGVDGDIVRDWVMYGARALRYGIGQWDPAAEAAGPSAAELRESVEWFELAAALGVEEARLELATCAHFGDCGAPADAAAARALYDALALRGHPGSFVDARMLLDQLDAGAVPP